MDVMCLHVIVRHHDDVTHEGLLDDVLKAFVGFVGKALADSSARSVFLEWSTPEMRKVVRRAKGSAWERASREAFYCTENVAFFLPTLLSEIPPVVKRLQVSGTDYPRSGLYHVNDTGLCVSVNPSVVMSTGKTAAQVLHAVHMRIISLGFPDDVSSWVPVLGDEFALSADIIVRDAGHTEVESGTVTVSMSGL